jgi:hypothetical protein
MEGKTVASQVSGMECGTCSVARTRVVNDGSLYLLVYGILLPRMKQWGLIDRRFHGRSQTECQRGSSGLFTCKARTVARAPEPAFRKAGHDRRLP